MSTQSKPGNSLVRGTLIVASLTFLSRIFGFIRDLTVASIFGASALADCFFVAFKIPNLLRSFLAEGALTSAFVPIFTGELHSGKENAQKAFSSILIFLSLTTLLTSAIGIIYAPELIQIIAPGFLDNKETAELCVLLTRIMLPYIIFISIVAMLNAALNSMKIFGAAALAQVLMNITLIIGAGIAAFFDRYTGVIILSVSVLAGGLVQVISQLPAIRKSGLKFWSGGKIFSTYTWQLLKLMLPALLGATVYQISQFVSTLLASLLVTGSISWLFYADRVTQLPIGIFSVALGSVLLPILSLARAAHNEELFSRNLVDSLRYTSFFIIPVSFLIFIFAEPLIRLMFERGAFSSVSSLNTALATQGYALGLWFVSCHSMLARAFIARKNTITPTVIGIITLVLSFALSLILMGQVSVDSGSTLVKFVHYCQTNISNLLSLHLSLGHTGLALAASVASLASFLLLFVLAKINFPGFNCGEFIKASNYALFISLICSVVVFFIRPLLQDGLISETILLLAWIAAFALLSRILNLREFIESFNLIKKRFLKNA